MDILRNTIEAIFYATPVEQFAEAILSDDDGYGLLSAIKETLAHIDPRYTPSEIEILDNVLEDSWMKFERGGCYSLIQRMPLILEHFSKKVLICTGSSDPIVDFDNLLRWRQISLLVGEDTLIIPRLAKYDSDRARYRKNLLWPNVLNHNNFRLNSILDKELSDTHSHVNAANDIFEFNWLSLMNYYRNPDAKTRRTFMASGARMEYDRTNRFSRINNSLEEWAKIAAAIRLKLFQLNNNLKSEVSIKEIYEAVEDNERLERLSEKVRLEIASAAEDALETERNVGAECDDSIVVDYAIRKEYFRGDFGAPATPFMIHYGERRLLYDWFLNYYNNSGLSRSTADLMMLYIVIKNKVRREFVQTNILQGFTNFQEYQNGKSIFIAEGKFGKAYRNVMFRYAVQSSLTDSKSHYLEARVCPGEISRLMYCDYNKSIFGSGNFCEDNTTAKVSLVAHFIKSEDTVPPDDNLPRHIKLRDTLTHQVKTLLSDFRNNPDENKLNPLTGIDAASSELNCRPEVFAPFFRFLRFNGLSNFTFHAGEDFYDIADGLRTIDETICFFGYKTGNRIGHGLALGTDAAEFYETRHNTVIIPRQILLDNLVWLKCYAAANDILLSPRTLLLIDEFFHSLISKLGYPDNPSITEYRESMNLRGDYLSRNIDDVFVTEPSSDYRSELRDDELPREVQYSPVSKGKTASDKAHKLHIWYERSTKCRIEGAKTEIVIFPPHYAEEIARIQDKMLDSLEDKGIVIETNPSSNIKIGRFSRYDQHPIFRFHNVATNTPRHSMVVSINTDDKGVFATSLRNEYSLIAIALKKMKGKNGERLWSDLQIETYLSRIAHYGNISRFRVNDMEMFQ